MPQGLWPVAAKYKTEPAAKLSTAFEILPPWNCSGENHVGVPATAPVFVSAVASLEKEIPKSIIRGPVADMRMLEGLISRWITLAA